MGGEDEIRPCVEWYAAALASAVQAIAENEDVGQVIREAVDGLSEAEVRNVLTVIIGHQAQQAIKHGKRKRN